MAEMALHSTRLAGKKPPRNMLLPQVLDATGVLADQHGLEVLDGAHDRQLAAAQAGFADALDALVGLDNHKQVVVGAIEDGEGLDA